MAAYFSGLSSGSPLTAYVVIGLFAAGIAMSLTTVGVIVQIFGNRLTNAKPWFSRLPWTYQSRFDYVDRPCLSQSCGLQLAQSNLRQPTTGRSHHRIVRQVRIMKDDFKLSVRIDRVGKRILNFYIISAAGRSEKIIPHGNSHVADDLGPDILPLHL